MCFSKTDHLVLFAGTIDDYACRLDTTKPVQHLPEQYLKISYWYTWRHCCSKFNDNDYMESN